MKKKILCSVVLITLITFIIILFLNYNANMNKYKRYTDENLDCSFKYICDVILQTNATLEYAIENGYITEHELARFNDYPSFYVRSFAEVERIAYTIYDFSFNSYNNRYKYSSEHIDFYTRISDLFEEEEYDYYSIEKRFLTNEELETFKQSYEYTSKVTDIIKSHIDYYNTYDYELVEHESLDGRKSIQLQKIYKEEYLIPWEDNRDGSGGSVSVTVNEDGTITETVIHEEVPRYDYPINPFISADNKEWFEIFKEMYTLNIKKKY